MDIGGEDVTSSFIMLLGDDLRLRDALASAVGNKGVEIVRVSQTTQAHALFATMQVDLLIVNGPLRESEGVAFVEEVRHAGYQGEIIYCSAFDVERDFPRVFANLTSRCGVSQVLQKPVSQDVLLSQVEQLLFSTQDPAPVGPVVHEERQMPARGTDTEDFFSAYASGEIADSATSGFAVFPEESIQSSTDTAAFVADLEDKGRLLQQTDTQQDAYQELLGRRMQTLWRCLQGFEDEELEISLRRAHELAYKLRGSARILGFIDVSETLSQIEGVLTSLLGTLSSGGDFLSSDEIEAQYHLVGVVKEMVDFLLGEEESQQLSPA